MKTNATDSRLKRKIRTGLWQCVKDALMACYHRKVIAFLSHNARKGDRVLDLGCGRGKFTQMFIEEFGDLLTYMGIDRSKEALEMAASECGLNHFEKMIETWSNDTGTVMLDVGDVTKIRIRDNYYDFVLCIMVAHHLDHYSRDLMMHEIFRVLKPGGKALIVDHGMPSQPHGWIWWVMFRKHYFAKNCAQVVMEMARWAGFSKPEIICTQFGWTYHILLRKPSADRRRKDKLRHKKPR